jgi:hypothetical protein
MIPLVLHFYAVSGQSWGAEGAKFSTAFFSKNVAINGLYFFNNKEFPTIFMGFSIIGLIAWSWRRGPREAPAGANGQTKPPAGFRSTLLMLLWFLLFWGIFLFFYSHPETHFRNAPVRKHARSVFDKAKPWTRNRHDDAALRKDV